MEVSPCERCGAEGKIIAFVEEERVIKMILRHGRPHASVADVRVCEG